MAAHSLGIMLMMKRSVLTFSPSTACRRSSKQGPAENAQNITEWLTRWLTGCGVGVAHKRWLMGVDVGVGVGGSKLKKQRVKLCRR